MDLGSVQNYRKLEQIKQKTTKTTAGYLSDKKKTKQNMYNRERKREREREKEREKL